MVARLPDKEREQAKKRQRSAQNGESWQLWLQKLGQRLGDGSRQARHGVERGVAGTAFEGGNEGLRHPRQLFHILLRQSGRKASRPEIAAEDAARRVGHQQKGHGIQVAPKRRATCNQVRRGSRIPRTTPNDAKRVRDETAGVHRYRIFAFAPD